MEEHPGGSAVVDTAVSWWWWTHLDETEMKWLLLLLFAGDLSQVHEVIPICPWLPGGAHEDVVPPVVPPVQLQLGGDLTVPHTLLPGAVPLISVASKVSLIGGDGLLSPQGLPLAVLDGGPPVPPLLLLNPVRLLIVVDLPSSVPEVSATLLACSSR